MLLSCLLISDSKKKRFRYDLTQKSAWKRKLPFHEFDVGLTVKKYERCIPILSSVKHLNLLWKRNFPACQQNLKHGRHVDTIVETDKFT